MSPFAPIYWRRIKAGARTIDSVLNETVKMEVKDLAKAEVVSGEISPEQYLELIGEEYTV